jgi:hypothetical protein
LGEKLAVFIKFKMRDPSALRPQDDKERSNGVILSEAKNLFPFLPITFIFKRGGIKALRMT